MFLRLNFRIFRVVRIVYIYFFLTIAVREKIVDDKRNVDAQMIDGFYM